MFHIPAGCKWAFANKKVIYFSGETSAILMLCPMARQNAFSWLPLTSKRSPSFFRKATYCWQIFEDS